MSEITDEVLDELLGAPNSPIDTLITALDESATTRVYHVNSEAELTRNIQGPALNPLTLTDRSGYMVYDNVPIPSEVEFTKLRDEVLELKCLIGKLLEIKELEL